MHEQTDDLGIEVIDVSADTAVALDPITRAEIDIAITTAKRYPRRIAQFSDEVQSLATIDQETAEGCFYSLRRQGKTIQGPSVRLAEIAISCWGNIRAGARIMGKTEDGRFIRAMGVCHDLEKNVYIAMESQRRITTREGRVYGDDMIGVTANAAAAIGFRNAAFKVIPKALIKAAYVKCMEVATGGAKTLRERREQVFERLCKLNPLITEERILSTLGKPSIEEVTLSDVTHLIGLGTAIRDGAQNVDEAFPELEAVIADDIIEPAGAAEAEGETPDPETATEEAAPEEPEPAAEPPEEPPAPKVISSGKVASLRRQASQLAGMDADALDRFSRARWKVPLEELPAEHEAGVLGEIRRRAKKRK